MSVRQPSRLAFAVLDFFVPDDAVLKGDLMEAFQSHRSQAWLWRQVMGAVIHQWRPFRSGASLGPLLVGTVLLCLLSFEVVFVANVLYRLLFGPPPTEVWGYWFLLHKFPPARQPLFAIPSEAWIYPSLRALAIALPAGWWLARRLDDDHRHRVVAIAMVTIGIISWAVVHLPLPFSAQFLSMLSLTAGFLAGGRMAAAMDKWRVEHQRQAE